MSPEHYRLFHAPSSEAPQSLPMPSPLGLQIPAWILMTGDDTRDIIQYGPFVEFLQVDDCNLEMNYVHLTIYHK